MEKDDMSITETYLRCELESTSLENEMNVRVSN
jgi:hypothetical protein